tara:strand:+ start:920 stop:1804 length:885 start_codon:yes stop_codon:yes gene_type:complete
MATSRMARRNLAKAQLQTKQNEAKGKFAQFAANEAAGLAEFAITATQDNRDSNKDFEAGKAELGIDTNMPADKGMFSGIKNFMNKNFTNANDMATKEFYSEDNRTYTGADISFAGRMRNSKDPQVQMMLRNNMEKGSSLSESLNLGEDFEGGMSELDMQFKANESIKRRGMRNNKQSIASMDSGTGTLSQLSGIESSMSTNTKGFFDKLNFDFTKENPIPQGNIFNEALKLDEGQREAIKTFTGPDGAELKANSKGQIYYLNKNGNAKVVVPGSDEWKKIGLDEMEMTNDKGIE